MFFDIVLLFISSGAAGCWLRRAELIFELARGWVRLPFNVSVKRYEPSGRKPKRTLFKKLTTQSY
jgi:hypothetical protein